MVGPEATVASIINMASFRAPTPPPYAPPGPWPSNISDTGRHACKREIAWAPGLNFTEAAAVAPDAP